jgi:phosphatidylglycerophosphatase A
MSPKSSLSLFLASGCYIGFIPGAPGTYASVATTAVLYAVSRTQAHAGELYVSVFCLVTAAGVLASTEAARSRGLKDPSFVVIDEVSGQLATFLLVPLELRNLVLGTALFRLFDIWKPFPIRRLERLPGGAGIMADDVLAGLYATAILYLVNRVMGG